jgi:hypothetical protein
VALFFCVLAISASMACRVFRRGRHVRRRCGGGAVRLQRRRGGCTCQQWRRRRATGDGGHGGACGVSRRSFRACSWCRLLARQGLAGVLLKGWGDLMGGPRQTGAAAVGSVRSPMHEGNVNSASEPIQQKALHRRYMSGVLRRRWRRREWLRSGVFPRELQRCMAILISQVLCRRFSGCNIHCRVSSIPTYCNCKRQLRAAREANTMETS